MCHAYSKLACVPILEIIIKSTISFSKYFVLNALLVICVWMCVCCVYAKGFFSHFVLASACLLLKLIILHIHIVPLCITYEQTHIHKNTKQRFSLQHTHRHTHTHVLFLIHNSHYSFGKYIYFFGKLCVFNFATNINACMHGWIKWNNNQIQCMWEIKYQFLFLPYTHDWEI